MEARVRRICRFRLQGGDRQDHRRRRREGRLLLCGIGYGEMARADVRDYARDAGFLLVRGSRGRQWAVPVGGTAKAALDGYLDERRAQPDEPLFTGSKGANRGKRMGKGTIAKRCSLAYRDAGVTVAGRSLRGACASTSSTATSATRARIAAARPSGTGSRRPGSSATPARRAAGCSRPSPAPSSTTGSCP